MPIYKQTVQFTRYYEINAENAEKATNKLDHLVRDAEFGGDIEAEFYYPFEDDPVQCPDCVGSGTIYAGDEDEDGHDCPKCKGQGEIPFPG